MHKPMFQLARYFILNSLQNPMYTKMYLSFHLFIIYQCTFRAEKVIADTNGRFILVLGQLFANPIVLVTFGHIILNNQYSSSPSPSLFKDRI